MTNERIEYLKKLIIAFEEKYNTPELARHYLRYNLGTINKDGTICAEYGGAYTDIDHPVHSTDWKELATLKLLDGYSIYDIVLMPVRAGDVSVKT